jgi:hypothetical protein
VFVDSVYLLLPDGRCIFSKSYSGSNIDPHLLGGLLNAFNIASQQWLKDGVRKFVSEEGMNFVIKDFSSFLVVISGFLNPEEEIILEKIGMRFLSKFGDKIERWQKGNIGILKNFSEDLNKILNVSNIEIAQEKTNQKDDQKVDEPYLDSLTIISLPIELQKTALTLLTLKSANLQEISNETKRDLQLEKISVEKLVDLGYISKKSNSDENKIIYYLP